MVGFTFERRLRVAPGGAAGGWWAGLFPGRNRSLVGGAVSAAQAGGWWAGLCRGEAGSVWAGLCPRVEPETGGRGRGGGARPRPGGGAGGWWAGLGPSSGPWQVSELEPPKSVSIL